MDKQNINSSFENEVNEIKERYARRSNLSSQLYSPTQYYSLYARHEKEKTLLKWIRKRSIIPVENKTLLEIGCGNGSNILQLINLGFKPSNITGNELLPERVNQAKELLSSKVNIIEGNALTLDLPHESYDIVYQSMVFSSILNKEFRIELAKKMWDMVKPGGGVLWYDFIYNNPKNKDVTGITYNEVKSLFPAGKIIKWKITLAPPVSRMVAKIHPSLYTLINFFPFMRTHILCWISKNQTF